MKRFLILSLSLLTLTSCKAAPQYRTAKETDTYSTNSQLYKAWRNLKLSTFKKQKISNKQQQQRYLALSVNTFSNEGLIRELIFAYNLLCELSGKSPITSPDQIDHNWIEELSHGKQYQSQSEHKGTEHNNHDSSHTSKKPHQQQTGQKSSDQEENARRGKPYTIDEPRELWGKSRADKAVAALIQIKTPPLSNQRVLGWYNYLRTLLKEPLAYTTEEIDNEFLRMLEYAAFAYVLKNHGASNARILAVHFLNLSSRSTHAEIKAQCKKYRAVNHPDKNNGSEESQRIFIHYNHFCVYIESADELLGTMYSLEDATSQLARNFTAATNKYSHVFA